MLIREGSIFEQNLLGLPYLPLPTAEDICGQQRNQVNIAITLNDAYSLLDASGYERSFGLGIGTHYRKERGEGCYHLRVLPDRALLHWDRWDPRRFPLRHFFESPQLWGPAAGVAVLATVFALASDD